MFIEFFLFICRNSLINAKEKGGKLSKTEELNTIVTAIKVGDKKVYEQLYLTYYNKLCHFLSGYTTDDIIIEDVVQEVFLKIWTKRQELHITISLNSYLYRAAYVTLMENHRYVKRKHDMLSSYYYTALTLASDKSQKTKDLQLIKLEECIASLPQRCQEIFRENKLNEKKYADVAQKFNVSVKTVEAHISRALAILRECLTK
ncbi:sigma-70 family RNA polymerase sigma factor [Flavobacterium sp. MAHUQ-51]|uniref:sigma-70 family RNA polymerase sigma factor n=1 Tax=Flavobacterium sp. GCM10022190 TaxID=3252639 RepID=UPI0036211C62